jgi:3-methyladenine DNA glycosylase/8-oxoguanine DNA glycosylase
MIVHEMTFSTGFDFTAVSPYSFELTVHKPAGWSLLTPYEVFESETLWTVLRVPPEAIFGLKMKSVGTAYAPRISCRVYSERRLGMNEATELPRVIRWMLSADESISEFYALATRDSLVRSLVEDLYGMRSTKQPDLFSRLILAVTLQMAPIARSNQMMELLIKQYGEKAQFDQKEILYWPSAQTIAETSVAELKRNCKLGYRSTFLKGIAETVRNGFPFVQELEKMSPKEAKLKLMELNGIGEYSADIVSPHSGFALDIWSARIFHMLFFGSEPKSPRDVIPKLKRIAEERWGQWRSYVFLYVLHDLDRLSKRLGLNLTQA